MISILIEMGISKMIFQFEDLNFIQWILEQNLLLSAQGRVGSKVEKFKSTWCQGCVPLANPLNMEHPPESGIFSSQTLISELI